MLFLSDCLSFLWFWWIWELKLGSRQLIKDLSFKCFLLGGVLCYVLLVIHKLFCFICFGCMIFRVICHCRVMISWFRFWVLQCVGWRFSMILWNLTYDYLMVFISLFENMNCAHFWSKRRNEIIVLTSVTSESGQCNKLASFVCLFVSAKFWSYLEL